MLRSVSPIHLEYMANMGVRATMSLSLVIGGRLWGMIACHHHAPRLIPYPARLACEALAQVLSAALANIEGSERAEQARRSAALVSRLAERVSDSENVHQALSGGPDTPASLVPNDAALCLWGNSVTVFGGIAPRGELAGILCALDQSGQRLVHTNNIARDYPELQTDLVPYAGLMACKFDPMNNGWLVWLRREQIETVIWGGKPEKQYAVGTLGPRLTPRGSFEAWREVMRDTSAPGWPPNWKRSTTCATSFPISPPAARPTSTAPAPPCWPCSATTCAIRCSPSRWRPPCCPGPTPAPAWANASAIRADGCSG
ncbi:GAF domain-containing protein [Achromobacter xylosoxidans]